MEYPRLYEQITAKIKRLDEQVQNTRSNIQKALAIAERHETGGREELHQKKLKAIEGLRKREKGLIAEKDALSAEAEELSLYNHMDQKFREGSAPESHYYRAGIKFWDIPNSRWKTYQDIFTPFQFRLRPKRQGPVVLMDAYDDLSLRPCVVDPDRITDSFLREFEMPLPPADSNALQKLKFKEALIPDIVDFFENHVKPMKKPSRMGEGKNWRLMVVQNYGSEHDGKIINPRYVGKGEENKKRKVMQFFENAYATRRKSDHVDRQYKNETRFLIGKAEDLSHIHRRLLNLIGLPEPEKEREKQEILISIHLLLEDILKVMREPDNEHKRSAKQDLVNVAGLKDRLNRDNLGASLARMLKIIRNLKTRKSQVFTTSLASPEDAKTLEDVIEYSEKIINQHLAAFSAFFKNGDQRPLMALNNLSSLQIRPFNLYATFLQDVSDSIVRGSQTADGQGRREAAINGVSICKLFNIEREREMILYEITGQSVEPGLDTLLEYARRLYRSVNTNQMNKHKAVFDSIKEGLRLLTESLKQMNAEKKTPQELYQAFKNGLKEIDFEYLIGEISQQ
jgi:hypothetical protein